MTYVACIVAVAPIRKEPDHRSEMVSQLLLGEFAEMLESVKNFVRVKCLYDGYEGWCQRSQLEETADYWETDKFAVDGISYIRINGERLLISAGTPVFKGTVKLGKFTIDYTGMEQTCYTVQTKAFGVLPVSGMAAQYISTPYLWGGKSVFGIDCSGLTQQVYKFFGIKLPRDAWQQAEMGESVGFLEEAVCGDLAFFDNEEGHITHVGVLLNSGMIVHASGYVRADKIDHAGIIHSVTGERTHNLRLIKRYRKLTDRAGGSVLLAGTQLPLN